MWFKLIIVLVTVGGLAPLLMQLAGPDENVELSKETTFIVKPLAEDGLPNYALAILEKQREGVTGENNAAPDCWRAMGLGGIEPELFALVCEDLQIDPTSIDESQFLVDPESDEVAARLAKWFGKRPSAEHAEAAAAEAGDINQEKQSFEQLAEATSILQVIQKRPWTAEQFPPVAEWLAENNAPLDQLVVASKKPRFYSAPPNLLLDANTAVVDLLLPHAQQMRTAARGLSARAMHRTALGQYDLAWEDSLACWRLGQLIGNDPMLVERLVGIALRQVARQTTLAILQSNNLPKPVAEQMLADLTSLQSSIDIAASIDWSERLTFLDSALRYTTDRLGGASDISDDERLIPHGAIDPNVPLQIGNDWYDRIAVAVSVGDWQQRRRAIDKVDADLSHMGAGVKGKMLQGVFSRSVRSQWVGEIFVAFLVPALHAAIEADERDQIYMQLTRIAAALAIYRAMHGEYPAALAELAKSNVIARVPHDPYTDREFVYQRRADGYLLYSLFQNGKDDGGSDFINPIVNGEWTAEVEFNRPALDECDLVIRVPQPPLPAVAPEK